MNIIDFEQTNGDFSQVQLNDNILDTKQDKSVNDVFNTKLTKKKTKKFNEFKGLEIEKMELFK